MSVDSYTVMSGAGNTFAVAGGERLAEVEDPVAEARRVCTALDVDGLILVEPLGGERDFRMHYFNRDGSTGMMCGNGGRCAVAYARRIGAVRDAGRITFENAGVDYTARLTGLGVSVAFPAPRRIEQDLQIDLVDRTVAVDFVDVGTPHAVLQVKQLGLDSSTLPTLDIDLWGAALRRHERFQPEGANANFIALDGRGEVHLRTFERGVEAETGACGTGAIATALVSHLRYGLPSPVTVIPTSGSPLRVHFTEVNGEFSGIELEGGAEEIGRSVRR